MVKVIYISLKTLPFYHFALPLTLKAKLNDRFLLLEKADEEIQFDFLEKETPEDEFTEFGDIKKNYTLTSEHKFHLSECSLERRQIGASVSTNT